jgi:stage II sporulation SpoE-like protein
VTVDMAPGSVLAMYTDGLFRAGPHGAKWDADRVTGELAVGFGEGRPLPDLCESLMPAATDVTLRDDVAMPLARTRAVGAKDVCSRQFPAEATSVAEPVH